MTRQHAMRTLFLALAVVSSAAHAQSRSPSPSPKPAAQTQSLAQAPVDSALTSATISGLKFRSIGPALTSGRVVDIAVDPTNKKVWYIAAAAGGVWKTTNGGTNFTPIFDSQGSFSIGTITIDPKNPNVVWVGSGENNAQRV